MNVEILYRPSYSVAQVILERQETIQVECGALLGMSPDMEMQIPYDMIMPTRIGERTDIVYPKVLELVQ